jgi:fatty acid desaturase
MRDTPARININDYLARDQIRALGRRSTWWGVAMVVHCWAVIAAAMALVTWAPNPLTILLAIAVIGSRQLGLGILMHEGAHGGLARNWTVNLWLSQWLCSYPVFAETLAYRRYHLTHHRLAQTKGDPDLSLSAPFPTTSASLRRKIVRDLSGQTGFKQRGSQWRAALGKPGQPLNARVRLFGDKLGRPLLVNAAMAGGLAALGYWWLYPLLWVVPLLTWYQLVTRIRNIAEHAMVRDADPWRVARTTHAGWIERAFLAPYYVNYHAEHHLMLYVPCYRLPAMHRTLRAAGLDARLETAPGYRAVLRMAADMALSPSPRPR